MKNRTPFQLLRLVSVSGLLAALWACFDVPPDVDGDGGPIDALPSGACLGPADCTSAALPYCVDQRCVECEESASCPTGAPFCEANACRGCQADEECESGVCDESAGTCPAASDLIHVALTGTDTGTCTSDAPCKTIGFALGQVSGSRRHIKVAAAAGMYPGEDLVIDGTAVFVYADGVFMSSATCGTPPWRVINGGSLDIEGIKLQGPCNPGNGVVVQCTGSQAQRSAFTLDHGVLDSGFSAGISGSWCKLDIQDSFITGFSYGAAIVMSNGGIRLERSKIRANRNALSLFGLTDGFVIRNNFLIQNGNASNQAETTVVIDGFLGGTDPIFEFNTVAGNDGPDAPSPYLTGGVSAEATFQFPMTFRNNIVYGNIGQNSNDQVEGGAAWVYSDIGPTPATGTGNISLAPLFVDPGVNGDFHLDATSAGVDDADPSATLLEDFDGDARPQGGQADMGADEVAP